MMHNVITKSLQSTFFCHLANLRIQQRLSLVIGNLIPDHRREHNREALVKQGFEGK